MAALVIAAGPGSAAAGPACDDPIDDPIAVPWRDAGFDGGRAACLGPAVNLTVRGRALIDAPAFYGTLGGDAVVGLRVREGRHVEWGLAARGLDLTFLQNAVWKVIEPSYGPLLVSSAVGVERALAGRPLALALATTIELPFTRSQLGGSTGAVQLAGVATWRARARLRLHARVALLGWYGADVTGATVRGAAAASVDASARVVRWLAVDVGLDAQAGWYGVTLDHVAVRVGARWRVKGPWRAEVGAGAPVVGRERQDLVVTLGVARDLD
ncbi:MAG: hypothetical protein R3B06_23175 [Kofleriaceae bacterium]